MVGGSDDEEVCCGVYRVTLGSRFEEVCECAFCFQRFPYLCRKMFAMSQDDLACKYCEMIDRPRSCQLLQFGDDMLVRQEIPESHPGKPERFGERAKNNEVWVALKEGDRRLPAEF